jgi:hypothetical protein
MAIPAPRLTTTLPERAGRLVRTLSWWPRGLMRESRVRRRFHAYCVSMGKSGTHSLAETFGERYRASHERDAPYLVSLMLDAERGAIGARRLAWYIRARDQRRRWEMESSMLLLPFLDILVREFPRARFILAIRDCYSWLDSQLNQHLANRAPPPSWRRFRELKFGVPAGHPREERALAELGLFTLDGYLASWAEHNRRVLAAVPRDRLLVIRTHEIARDLPAIAEFVGVPADTVSASRAHSYKAAVRLDVPSRLDPAYLEERFEAHCGELMRAHFPELGSYREWRAARRETAGAGTGASSRGG